MLRELIGILRGSEPLRDMAQNFARMLRVTFDQTVRAGGLYFGDGSERTEREEIYATDREVNELEQVIRKQVLAHLAMRTPPPDVPYCLLLMSLVKDVERIGDYAKNLADLAELRPEALPDDENVRTLQSVRDGVEAGLRETFEVFDKSDAKRAMELIQQGREIEKKCDSLLGSVAAASYDGRTTMALALGARYYKRIGSHTLNVLSGVVVPLHQLDMFDEDEISETS